MLLNNPFPKKIAFLFALAFFSVQLIAQKAQERITQKISGTKLSFELSAIPGGAFTWNEKDIAIDEFYCATTEMTHDIFVIFRRAELDSDKSSSSRNYKADAITRPSPPYEDLTKGMGDKGGFPAVSMTQQSALRFCRWLYFKTGEFYRLPTEAEWTYLLLLDKDHTADEEFAWMKENSNGKYHKVARKTPNVFGLYDLYGNVLEWTMDQWSTEPLGKEDATLLSNPWEIPTRRNYRVLKGGSFMDQKAETGPFVRYKSQKKWQERDPQIPKSRWWLTDGPFVGFRVVKPKHEMDHSEIMAFYEKAIID